MRSQSDVSMSKLIYGFAGLGPLLFFAIATVEGLLRPGYDPITQPISALALGERGWIQAINFVILSLSLLAMAAVLRRELRGRLAARAAPAAFVVMALAVAVAAIFPMDAPGAPETRAGAIHMAAGFLLFPWIPVVILGLAMRFRRDERQRAYGVSVVAGLFCLVTISFFLIFVGPPGFDRPYPALVGVVQRLELLCFFTWIASIALHAPSAIGTTSSNRQGPESSPTPRAVS
jgi:hypothetical protein